MNKIMKEKEFEFKLEEPILYQHPGGESTTDLLLFKGFSKKHMFRHEDNLFEMRKMLSDAYIVFMQKLASFSALADDNNKKSQEDAETKETKGQDLLFNMLLFSCMSDIKKYNDIFWELMVDDICYVDRKVKLTKDLKDEMSFDDKSNILIEYTKNFILPSWMKAQFVN